jgi:RimJ/RimL family protein N-acetyltransferase
MVEITAERLLLRPFQVDDLEAFVAYRSDLEVAPYQWCDKGMQLKAAVGK